MRERIEKVWALLEAMEDDDPLFEKALQKLYFLGGLDAGLPEESAADVAWGLITDWRWRQACAGKAVGMGPLPPRTSHSTQRAPSPGRKGAP